MFCTTECWNCEDKNCEHYKSKRDLYFENKKLKGAIETYEILIKANNINNWNELKKFIEAKVKYWEEEEKKWIELGFMKFGGEANNKLIFKIVLDKMQELEGNNE